MADNIVGGLFGIDPAALQQQQQSTMTRNAFNYANLSPAEQGQYGAYVAGGLTGQAAQGLLGIEDPQLKKAKMAQQLATQFDITSPEGLKQYASALAQNGAPDLASMAVQRAASLEKTASEVTKNLREKQIPTSGLGKLMFERDELLKSGVDPRDPKILAYDKAIAAEGKGKGNVEVNLGGIFDKMFTKKEAEDQAEAWNKAGQAYAEAGKLNRSVREMESVVGNAFVGSYGSLKAGVSKALGGGKKLEDTEVLDALSAQLVLPLAKLLPGSLAVKELDQLIKTKPNLNQQEATIRRLLGTISQDLKASEITYEAGEKYRSENKGSIQGFNPYITNNKATRFTELQGIFKKNGKLTDEQKKEAQALAKELKVEAM